VSADEVRHAWLEQQAEDVAQATANKQPQEALLTSAARYRLLSDADRAIVDGLLADQLSSPEEDDRFLALALIEDFEIVSAVPDLRRLADWLETQQWPGAPYEWAKVNRIIGKLATTRS
jgi:hypothetical protein